MTKLECDKTWSHDRAFWKCSITGKMIAWREGFGTVDLSDKIVRSVTVESGGLGSFLPKRIIDDPQTLVIDADLFGCKLNPANAEIVDLICQVK